MPTRGGAGVCACLARLRDAAAHPPGPPAGRWASELMQAVPMEVGAHGGQIDESGVCWKRPERHRRLRHTQSTPPSEGSALPCVERSPQRFDEGGTDFRVGRRLAQPPPGQGRLATCPGLAGSGWSGLGPFLASRLENGQLDCACQTGWASSDAGWSSPTWGGRYRSEVAPSDGKGPGAGSRRPRRSRRPALRPATTSRPLVGYG